MTNAGGRCGAESGSGLRPESGRGLRALATGLEVGAGSDTGGGAGEAEGFECPETAGDGLGVGDWPVDDPARLHAPGLGGERRIASSLSGFNLSFIIFLGRGESTLVELSPLSGGWARFDAFAGGPMEVPLEGPRPMESLTGGFGFSSGINGTAFRRGDLIFLVFVNLTTP